MNVQPDDAEHRPARAHWARVLLILPFLAMFWVGSFNSIEPAIAGVPFFYWYQMAWVLLCAVIVGIVFLLEH